MVITNIRVIRIYLFSKIFLFIYSFLDPLVTAVTTFSISLNVDKLIFFIFYSNFYLKNDNVNVSVLAFLLFTKVELSYLQNLFFSFSSKAGNHSDRRKKNRNCSSLRFLNFVLWLENIFCGLPISLKKNGQNRKKLVYGNKLVTFKSF